MSRNRWGIVVAILLVSLLLVTGSVLGASTVDPVLPRAYSDVPSGTYSPIFNYLGALRIFTGEGELGGPIRPNEPLTRVEFTAIIIRLAAEQSLATQYRNQVPGSSDGPDVPRWAWGVVSAARELGLVRGYPDGSFRPYEIVTQGEVLTVLARLLQWQPEPWGQWDGYVGRAVKGGLAGRLRLDLIERAPAYRHEVAHMAFMALSAKPEGSQKTLFDRQFTNVYGVFGSYSVADNKVTIDGISYTLANPVVLSVGQYLSDLIGFPVRAVLDGRNRILFLDPLVGL